MVGSCIQPSNLTANNIGNTDEESAYFSLKNL